MNKKSLLLTASIVVMVLVTSVVGVFVNRNLPGDVIDNEEPALEIGRALLEEHFGYDPSSPNYILSAHEENGIWTVYSSPIQHEDYITLDGGAYVKFRKSNGRVIEFYHDG